MTSLSLTPRRPRQRSTARCCGGFTLFELLIVLAIIGIIAAIVSPLVPALLRANQLDSSVNTLAGLLEEARESAMSGNTYVWVAFSDPPAASPVTGTWVATFQSQDGTENITSGGSATPYTTSPLTVPSGNLIIHGKLQNLPGVKIVDYTSLSTTLKSKPGVPTPVNLYEPGWPSSPTLNWTLTAMSSTASGTQIFSHAIEFTPDGQAHVPTWNSNIEFGLTTSIGTSTSNSVLFNTSRLTGKTSVYRM